MSELIPFILVFISVFLHAAWNTISKGTKPSLAFYTLMCFTASAIWLPFFIISDINFFSLSGTFYLLLAGSIAGEILYMAGLASAYRQSDISLVYPVARALPVMLVAVTTIIFKIGQPLAPWDIAGMVILTAGCLIMPIKSFRGFSLKPYCSSVMLFIITAAAGTTMYTIFDSCAMELLEEIKKLSILDTMAYLFIIEFSQAVGQLVISLCIKRERLYLKKLAFRSIYPVAAGCCSSSAYALILLAMTYVTNVSYIQAFRQLSLPLGFAAGVFFLHEKATLPKIIGVIVILTGLLTVIFL